MVVLCGMIVFADFVYTKTFNSLHDNLYCCRYFPPSPQSTMSLPVVIIMKKSKASKRVNMKIEVDYVATENVVDME